MKKKFDQLLDILLFVVIIITNIIYECKILLRDCIIVFTLNYFVIL